MKTEPNLYDYLREHCPDLDAAKRFMFSWANEHQQKLPWETECSYTARAMAAHVSAVLEGKPLPDGLMTQYLSTEYGPELYFAAWTRPE
jgi:hypothetical protein